MLKELGLNPMSDPNPRGLAVCPRSSVTGLAPTIHDQTFHWVDGCQAYAGNSSNSYEFIRKIRRFRSLFV